MAKIITTQGAFADYFSFTRASIANYLNSANQLRTEGTDEPVMRANGDGLELGAAATNVLLANRDLDNATYWAGSGVTVTTSDGLTGIASSGTVLTDDSDSVTGQRRQFIDGVADDSNPGTFSVYVKKTTSATGFPTFRFGFFNGSPQIDAFVVLNTDTGESRVATGTATRTEVQDHGDWWRLIIVVTNNNSGNDRAFVYIYPQNRPTFEGVDVPSLEGTIEIDYPQVELGVSEASAPIETTTTAATRAATFCDMNVSTFNDGDAFTIFGEFSDLSFDSSSEQTILYVSNGATLGTTSLIMLSATKDTGIYLKYYNASSTLFTATMPYSDSAKFAFTYDSVNNYLKAALDGVVYDTGASPTETLNSNNINLSQDNNPNSLDRMAAYTLKSLKVLGASVGDSELISATS